MWPGRLQPRTELVSLFQNEKLPPIGRIVMRIVPYIEMLRTTLVFIYVCVYLFISYFAYFFIHLIFQCCFPF